MLLPPAPLVSYTTLFTSVNLINWVPSGLNFNLTTNLSISVSIGPSLTSNILTIPIFSLSPSLQQQQLQLGNICLAVDFLNMLLSANSNGQYLTCDGLIFKPQYNLTGSTSIASTGNFSIVDIHDPRFLYGSATQGDFTFGFGGLVAPYAEGVTFILLCAVFLVILFFIFFIVGCYYYFKYMKEIVRRDPKRKPTFKMDPTKIDPDDSSPNFFEKEPVFWGFAKKGGKEFGMQKKWKKRYFIIFDNAELVYYHGLAEITGLAEALFSKGVLDYSRAEIKGKIDDIYGAEIKLTTEFKSHPYCILITKKR